MSGQWPPEWEDSDTGLPDAWTIDDAELDPEASAVASFLASVPSPVLPTAFQARISAAIAAEATARADRTGAAAIESAKAGMASAEADDAKTTDRSSSPEFSPAAAESGSATAAKHRRRRTSAASRNAARRIGPTGSRPDGRRRRFRTPSAAVTGPLLVLLVIAGFALVFSQFGRTSASSESASGSSGAPASASQGRSFASGRIAAGSVPQYETIRPGKNGPNAKFVVTESGTVYLGATLASQVRQQLDALGPSAVTPAASPPHPASPGGEPSAAGSAAAAPIPPPTTLAGCVSRLTGDVAPRLVDRASYDGTPAFIIAVPSRVWVVRLGCTAADPQEITSVSLTGLSGNLSALGSVEWYASSGERRISDRRT